MTERPSPSLPRWLVGLACLAVLTAVGCARGPSDGADAASQTSPTVEAASAAGAPSAAAVAAAADLNSRIRACVSPEHLQKLWVNPAWDAAPTTYQQGELYKLRRYRREQLASMVPARPMSEIPLAAEPEAPLLVDNVLSLLDAVLELAATTPESEMTSGQKVRLAAYQELQERYQGYRQALQQGQDVSLPRWYHARERDAFEQELLRRTAIDEKGFYAGAYLGSIPESRYGNYYLLFGGGVAKQDFALETCGTRIENTQIKQDKWASFIYLGFKNAFDLLDASRVVAIPVLADLDDITKTDTQMPAVKDAIAAVGQRNPDLGEFWRDVHLHSYHTANIENHLLSLARVCSPQRASELWYGTFQLADIQLQEIPYTEDASQAADILAAAKPGQIIAHSAPWRDSGLFVVVDDEAQCSVQRRQRPMDGMQDGKYCDVAIPQPARIVTRTTCSFPLEDRAPQLFDLGSNWLNPDNGPDKLSVSALTNLLVAPEDRSHMYQALANGRFTVEQPPER